MKYSDAEKKMPVNALVMLVNHTGTPNNSFTVEKTLKGLKREKAIWESSLLKKNAGEDEIERYKQNIKACEEAINFVMTENDNITEWD